MNLSSGNARRVAPCVCVAGQRIVRKHPGAPPRDRQKRPTNPSTRHRRFSPLRDHPGLTVGRCAQQVVRKPVRFPSRQCRQSARIKSIQRQSNARQVRQLRRQPWRRFERRLERPILSASSSFARFRSASLGEAKNLQLDRELRLRDDRGQKPASVLDDRGLAQSPRAPEASQSAQDPLNAREHFFSVLAVQSFLAMSTATCSRKSRSSLA